MKIFYRVLYLAVFLPIFTSGCQSSATRYSAGKACPAGRACASDRALAPCGAAAPETEEVAKELVEMAPFLGYLTAHDGVERPFALLGGPIRVRVTQNVGGVHLALPDYRGLDPRVFGNPRYPRAFAGTPVMNGVPPSMRNVKAGAYTTLKELSPFGDKYMVLPDGRYSLEALDVTATDAAATQDYINMEASWKDNEGNTYTVRCNEVAPHGVEYPSFGGVVTNHILHGSSRVGTPLMPTEFVYVAFWGQGETLKNGKVMDSNVLVHCMLTEYVRTTNYRLGFDEDVTPTRLQMHLIVPPVAVSGGKFEKRPVHTAFMMPDGEELPFWHVMFENLEIDAQRLPTRSAAAPGEEAPAPVDQKEPSAIVKMNNQLKFMPYRVTIAVGDAVEWDNTSDLVHTVTADPVLAIKSADVSLPEGAKPFNSGNIDPGATFRYTFTVPGTYRYFCIPHGASGMVGEVVVKGTGE